jgi:hypothetical protein
VVAILLQLGDHGGGQHQLAALLVVPQLLVGHLLQAEYQGLQKVIDVGHFGLSELSVVVRSSADTSN